MFQIFFVKFRVKFLSFIFEVSSREIYQNFLKSIQFSSQIPKFENGYCIAKTRGASVMYNYLRMKNLPQTMHESWYKVNPTTKPPISSLLTIPQIQSQLVIPVPSSVLLLPPSFQNLVWMIIPSDFIDFVKILLLKTLPLIEITHNTPEVLIVIMKNNCEQFCTQQHIFK